MIPLLFYSFSGIALLSALGVILLPRPTRALLCLIVTMLALAVLFTLLEAYFVAAIHVIVYAGAVLVLFLFVIMLQGIGAKDVPLADRFSIVHLILGVGISAALGFAFVYLIRETGFAPALGVIGTVEAIGKILFQKYLLPFELTSIVLLLGVFAAVALAKKDAEETA